MHDSPDDTDSTHARGPRPSNTARAVRAFGHAFAGVGAACAVVLAFLLPALLFRLDAARDGRVLLGLACALTWLTAFGAAAFAHATPASDRAHRMPGRAWAVAFALLPFVIFVGASRVRAALVASEDPLYGYCERGLSHRMAQPGIATPTSLAVEDGRLTLAVPTFPVQRARWWVDVDADDTVGRRCTFHAAVTFGDDPVVLRIPLPMASHDMPSRPFGLVPGSMVVVRAVRLTRDPAFRPASAPGSKLYQRRLDMVYEVPAPRGATRSPADFVESR